MPGTLTANRAAWAAAAGLAFAAAFGLSAIRGDDAAPASAAVLKRPAVAAVPALPALRHVPAVPGAPRAERRRRKRHTAVRPTRAASRAATPAPVPAQTPAPPRAPAPAAAPQPPKSFDSTG